MEGDTLKEQKKLKRECISLLNQQLENGKDFFLAIFPNATIRADFDSGAKRAAAENVLSHRIDMIQNAAHHILDASTGEDPLTAIQAISIERLKLTAEMSENIIQTIVKIFSCDHKLTEIDFLFLNEVSLGLAFPSSRVQYIIDQVQYECRKSFFDTILDDLNDDQCDFCAILLFNAIQADDQIHPAEIKYFENISQLLNYDQARLESIEEAAANFDFDIPIQIPEEISAYIFDYLVEIVMCDRSYDPKESDFIQNVAIVFGFDKQQQDEFIQPVVSALVIKADLFQ